MLSLGAIFIKIVQQVKENVQVTIGLFCTNISVESSDRPVDDL